jgi:uncharacterized damage-inducible protein DinB
MNGIDVIRRLHQHRQWVNHNLLNAVEPLTEPQLHQSFAIGQGSIWKTLTHLYAAEYVWLAALQGDLTPVAPGDLPDRLPGNQEGDGAITSLAELKGRWRELDDRWSVYFAELNDESLQQQVAKVNSLSGQRATTRALDVLLHLCTHAQYTTAQFVNMLRQLGVEDLPPTMLITMARQGF